MTDSETARQERRRHSRWLRGQVRHGGASVMMALLLPLVSGLLLIAQAWFLAGILDAVAVHGAALAAATTPIAIVLALIVSRALLGTGAEIAAIRGAEQIKRRVRAALLASAIDRPAASADTARSTGALSSAIVDQVETLDGFFVRFLPAMVQASLLPLAFAIAVMPTDLVVAAIFLITAPLIPIFMALVGLGAQAASDAQANALARLSGFFADRLRGLLTIRLLGRADDELALMRGRSEELRQRTFRVLRIAFLSSAVLELFAALGVAGVALYIGLSYLGMIGSAGAGVSLAAGLFCLLLAPEVYQPLRLLAAHYHDRAGAIAALKEMEAHFDTLPDAAPVMQTQPAMHVNCPALTVEALGLHVRAPDGRTLLRPGNLRIEAGWHVALTGPSGSGKTTLEEIVAGLRPAEGAVRVGGRLVADIDPQIRARQIGYISQKPRIFHGSIADNIRFGRPDASDAEVAAAAEAALVSGFTSQLPDGLATIVGERGFGLSGGEAHRVALARLFLRRPGLIVLDEPTAHLDAETEQALLQNILRFAEGRTLLLATHSDAVAAQLGLRLRIDDQQLIPTAQTGHRFIRSLSEDAA